MEEPSDRGPDAAHWEAARAARQRRDKRRLIAVTYVGAGASLLTFALSYVVPTLSDSGRAVFPPRDTLIGTAFAMLVMAGSASLLHFLRYGDFIGPRFLAPLLKPLRPYGWEEKSDKGEDGAGGQQAEAERNYWVDESMIAGVMAPDKVTQLRILMNAFRGVQGRLRDELDKLGRRNTTNLVVGGVVAAGGIVILAVTAFSRDYSGSHDLLTHFVPRVSLVLMIELFAYFFLRLYRAGLYDLRSTHNELSTLEARFAAVAMATLQESTGTVAKAIDRLGTIERNGVLSKGQSTVDIERARLDVEELHVLADFIKRSTARVPRRTKSPPESD